MRVCIVGGGLAGTLLAWRLAGTGAGSEVDLVLGDAGPDATSASGGGVRAYETHPVQRALATQSLVELLDSAVLRLWAGYRRTGSTYLRGPWPAAAAELAGIEAVLPGSAHLADAAELRRAGWDGLDDGAVAVVERQAGYVDPQALRHAVRAELARHPAVRLRPGRAVLGEAPSCTVDGVAVGCDVLVVAAGAWTPALLGLAGGGPPGPGELRVKAIQYALHPATGTLPPIFVDEFTGLYGRPAGAGTVLLGVPVSRYGGPPSGGEIEPYLTRQAAALAAHRLPGLRLGPATRLVRAGDCYTDPPVLGLHPVPGRAHTYTFTGGSGGSVKTALAASRIAAHHLTEHHATSAHGRNPSP